MFPFASVNNLESYSLVRNASCQSFADLVGQVSVMSYIFELVKILGTNGCLRQTCIIVSLSKSKLLYNMTCIFPCPKTGHNIPDCQFFIKGVARHKYHLLSSLMKRHLRKLK